MSRTLLVTGATGKQGGSLVRALLAQNADFRILAVTRDATSASAKRLAAKSPKISLVQGNLDDTESIFQAAKKEEPSIWGVFSVQTPAKTKDGATIEERQGKALVDSAVKHGVKHLVYSSVDRGGERSINNPTDIPHFISKHHIEHHLINSTKGGDMTWTILRPVAFMDNFDGFPGKVFATAWRVVVKSRPLQIIATEDIGVFAANAFLKPQENTNRAISLAGDELTYDQMAEVFQTATKSPVPTTWTFLVRIILWLIKDLGTMFTFFEKEGYGADVKALKKEHPELMDLEAWLNRCYHKQ